MQSQGSVSQTLCCVKKWLQSRMKSKLDRKKSTCTSTGIDYIWNNTQEIANEDWDGELEFESEGNLLFIIYPVIILFFFFFLPFVKITLQLKRNLAKEKIKCYLQCLIYHLHHFPKALPHHLPPWPPPPRCPKGRRSCLQTWSRRHPHPWTTG